MRSRRYALPLLLGLTFSTILSVPNAAAEQAAREPLTNEDVVLSFVSGTSLDALIERIRTSPVEFDLSDEMLEELRFAGLPEPLIDTMVERQKEIERERNPAAAETPVEATTAPPTLSVAIDGGEPSDDDTEPKIRLYQGIDPALAEALGLREENPIFTDVAVFLGCATADHVPDHWRSKTPLGRDFRQTMRHRLLAFFTGAERVEAPPDRHREGPPKLSVLELSLPERIEVELDPQWAHDLVLGIAVQTGDRYYLVVSDERTGLVLGDSGAELRATIFDAGSLSVGSLEVHFRH